MILNNYELIYLLFQVFGTYVIFKFMCIFFERKGINHKIELLSYIVYYGIIAIVYFMFNSPTINLIVNLILFYILTLNYSSTWRERFISVVLTYIILVSIETFAYIFIKQFLLRRIFEGTEIDLVIAQYSTYIISYIVALALSNFKIIKSKVHFTGLQWISVLIIPMGTIVLFYLIAKIADDLMNNTGIILITIAILFLINIFVFYLYDNLMLSYQERLEKKLLQQQNNAYIKQFELINQSQENLKILRHDFKNHLLALRAYIELGNNDMALNYLQNTYKLVDYSTEYAKSGNTVVDSILNYKLQTAKNLGIDFMLNLNIPMILNIKPFDMSVILGNLLDNAIEATSMLNENKKIEITVEYDRNVIYISTVNYFKGSLAYSKNKLVTTKEDKENHGFGLYSIKKALENYNGTMHISNTENKICIDIMMFNS
jgi:signal transduction histidine kinase